MRIPIPSPTRLARLFRSPCLRHAAPWIVALALVQLHPAPARAQDVSTERIETRQGQVGVQLEKEAELAVPLCPGGNIHYTVRIENIGTELGAAEIFDPIPAGTTFVPGSAGGGSFHDAANDRIVWEGLLAPGQGHSIGFSVIVDQGVASGTDLVNRATGRVVVGETVAETQVQVDVPVTCPPLALAVEKTAHFAQPLQCPEGNVFFEIRFTNLGDRTTVQEAVLEDPIPTGTTFEGSLTEGAVYDPVADRVTWEGPLGPGDTRTVGFSVTVDGSVGPGDAITNTATVTLSDPEVGDSIEEQATATVSCPEPPDGLLIELETSSSPDDPLCPGSLVEYVVRLTNPVANGRVLQAELVDPLPDGTSLFEGPLGGDYEPEPDERVVFSGPLAPGATREVRFVVRVDDDATAGRVIVNRAGATLTDPETGDSVSGEVEVEDVVEDCGAPPECPIEVIGFVEDSLGNGRGRHYPVSSSRIWLFDVEDDALPIAPLSEREYAPLRETRTNHTFETDFEDEAFPLPDRSGYELDFVDAGVSKCPPRAVVVSALWDADDRFALAPRNHVGGRYVPAYLARCISDVPDEVMPAGPCFEWRLQGGSHVPWDPVANRRAQVDFVYGSSPTNRESTRVIHDPATANPPLSESWDLGVGTPPDSFFQDAAHMYFFSYKAMEYLGDVAAAMEDGPALSPVLITPHDRDCATGCAWSAPQLADDPIARLPGRLPLEFGGLHDGGTTHDAGALVAFNSTVSSSRPFGAAAPGTGDTPDNREWHELGHYWMIELYGGDWPGGYRNDTAGCGDQPPVLPPVPPGFGNGNHCGYANESTSDSYIEGFAEFTSLLIAEHYDDPRPFLYHFAGNDRNLEVDHQVWGPYAALREGGELTGLRFFDPRDEDFAVAGILWDVHDAGSTLEPKARGVLSDVIRLEDRSTHSAVDLFDSIRSERPETVAGLQSILTFNLPGDADGDGYDDVDEIFIAHGVFDDEERDLRHDVGEFLGATGSSELPDRPTRFARRPLPNGFLDYGVTMGGFPFDPAGFPLELRYEFEPPFDHWNHRRTLRGTGRLHLNLAPAVFPSRVEITALGRDGTAGLRSAPLVITSDEYWNAVASGAPSVAEHTFVLEEEPVPQPPPGAWLASPELQGFEAKVEITPRGGASPAGSAGSAEPECIVETLCVSGALPGRPEVFVKVIGPRPNGKLWTQIGRFTPSEVEVWLRQTATGTIRYYRLASVGPTGDDVSGLQDREAFDPAGTGEAVRAVPGGPVLPGAAVERFQVPPAPLGLLEADPPEPPEDLAWLATPELPGFRFKARITPTGGAAVGGLAVEPCIPETLCIQGALPGRPEVFAKIIGPRPNGFLWVQAARFTPSLVELWVEQASTGAVRHYRLAPVGRTSDDVSGLQAREAFTP